MIKIGITGNKGFIGKHLTNYLTQFEYEIIPFDNSYFTNTPLLNTFVETCDIIIHLAAKNRLNDSKELYDTNIELVKILIQSCIETSSTPHIIFSSSTQENQNNDYGNSKKAGSLLLEEWAKKYTANVSLLIIPNVFGPFCKPNYNSVIATFCHKIINNELPEVYVDIKMKLIYINELMSEIKMVIEKKLYGQIEIIPRHELYVTELLKILKEFKTKYIDKGIIPNIESPLNLALFNTFRCYISKKFFPISFNQNIDTRGTFVEIIKTESKGQFSFSTTNPNITRGNHYHTRKAERFAIIKGKAKIRLRKIDDIEIVEYIIDGKNPAYVDIPIWHTHNITNIGDEELITLFWINEPFILEDSDTFSLNV
jgi:UDP-2-acetamido-2,6-beta-L-arabino-hexul-4-ose reductase